jgi:hypothetical protein
MNIDFHYGVVYGLARLAGLPVAEAQVVAHACQYVDDATTDGVLAFVSGESFERFASAHVMLDHQNSNNALNRTVWVPFHFLPAGEGPTLETRALCAPNSAIAQDMVRAALAQRNRPNGLHRLGVTLHVYVDTWAHQRFSGITSAFNRVTELESLDPKVPHGVGDWLAELRTRAGHLLENMAADVVTALLPLGHGAALSFPDQPWSHWKYRDGHGNWVERENLNDFTEAASMAFRVLQAFRTGGDFADQPGLASAQLTALRKILSENRNPNPQQRLESLSHVFQAGALPGLQEAIPPYIDKGENSWKHRATGLVGRDDEGARPVWDARFETSHYRHFHDAVKEHRFEVTQRILPAHNLRLV